MGRSTWSSGPRSFNTSGCPKGSPTSSSGPWRLSSWVAAGEARRGSSAALSRPGALGAGARRTGEQKVPGPTVAVPARTSTKRASGARAKQAARNAAADGSRDAGFPEFTDSKRPPLVSYVIRSAANDEVRQLCLRRVVRRLLLATDPDRRERKGA